MITPDKHCDHNILNTLFNIFAKHVTQCKITEFNLVIVFALGTQERTLYEKCPNTKFSSTYFPVFSPYLATFHAVVIV